jgi:hypothetical protein
MSMAAKININGSENEMKRRRNEMAKMAKIIAINHVMAANESEIMAKIVASGMA